jgi:cytochrome c-type biogenesis protein CcmF
MLTEFLTGKFITIVGFTAALISTFAFYRAAQNEQNKPVYHEWLLLARKTFMVMFGALVINGFHLLYLILSHQFQYNYVKHYSSTDLNLFYLISTFYAGQEGSFMLWMFYGALFGVFIMLTAKEYEAPVMTVLTLSQVFLLSMIMGVDVPALGMIGSDPFALTTGQVPKEGDGLNPLLQNPWMVIHPPTLFVGFASLIVPFSYAVAALWKNKYDDWIRPAMPWVLFSAVALGTGIMMGGYWAYKVLGWGGYWGWDPVENSSLVPWLFIVALLHTMMVQKKNGSLKRWNLFLAILAFSTILYSAFLTRSGILGDTSVHSFTDLGLYNQLALFCGGFLTLGLMLLAYRTKSIVSVQPNGSLYSREFFLFCGSIVLMLIGLVIAAGTSTPIYSKLTGTPLTKIDADFYNKVTLPLAVLIGLLSAVGQLIWWKKIDAENLVKAISLPLSAAMIFTSVLVLSGVREIGMILLALTAAFSLFANGQIFFKVAKGNLRFAGGSLAHVGLGLMLLGIIGSAKYDESKHVELPKGKPVEAFGKTLTYTGVQTVDGAKSGYKINIEDGGDTYTAMPIMYETKRMTVQNPDVTHYLTKDFYIAPVNLMKRKNPNRLVLSADEPQTIHGYAVTFTGFKMYQDPTTLDANATQPIKVGVKLSVAKDGVTESIEPTFTIVAGESPVVQPAALASNPAVSFAVTNIDANSRKIMVEVDGVGTTIDAPSETLIVEASEKPFINVLWIGTYLVVFGFMLSIYRRWKERNITSRVSTQTLTTAQNAPELVDVED